MLSPKLFESLNKQANFEYYSAWFYLAASGWARRQDYLGARAWFLRQADEERGHGRKFLNFIEDNFEKPELEALPAPQTNWETLSDAFQEARRHERAVTKSIDALFEIARDEKNFATEVFLQQFVLEQREELERLETICGLLQTIGTDVCALLFFDRELKTQNE